MTAKKLNKYIWNISNVALYATILLFIFNIDRMQAMYIFALLTVKWLSGQLYSFEVYKEDSKHIEELENILNKKMENNK